MYQKALFGTILGMLKEGKTERKEMPDKFRIVFLIGRGSRLPNILDKILIPESGITVPLVISHKKPPEGKEDVVGITDAMKRGIKVDYCNLAQMRAADKKAFPEEWDHPSMMNDDIYKDWWMRLNASHLTQQYYRSDIIFMTGWDLVLDENFMRFFPNVPVLNVHPHPLPDSKDDTIVAPDGATVPVLRGTEVWVKAIEQKLPWSGVTIHKIVPGEFDVGQVLAREWLKVDPEDTARTLREKLNEVEDRIVPETLLKIAKGEIKVA